MTELSESRGMPSAETAQPLFSAVGCAIRCSGRTLFLQRRVDKSYPGRWGLPGGKVEPGETVLQASIRELFEETSILLSAEQLSLFASYDVNNEEMKFEYTVFLYECQTQPEVKLDSRSHTACAWLALDESLRLPLIPSLDKILVEISLACKDEQQMLLFPELQQYQPPLAELERDARASRSFVPALQPKEWHVSFGPPGAGKTTTLKAIAKRYPRYCLISDQTILRAGSRLNQYFLEGIVQQNRMYFFHCQVEALVMRWRQAMEAPGPALVDETVFSTLAYSRALYRLGWLSSLEYQTFFVHYEHYRALLPPPTRILAFTCETETLQRRIRRRGRKVELHFSSEYLDALWHAFADATTDLAQVYNVVRIDTTRATVDEIVKHYGP